MDDQLFDDLIKSLREAREIAQGEAVPSRSFVVERRPDGNERGDSDVE